MKNYDIAIDYYSKGIKNDRTNVYFLIKRAICYLGKGFYTLALKDALKAIEIDSKYPKGYYIASLAYLEMFDIEKAEAEITKTEKQLKELGNLNRKQKESIAFHRDLERAKELYDKCQRNGIGILTVNDTKYPKKAKLQKNTPAILSGEMPDFSSTTRVVEHIAAHHSSGSCSAPPSS